MPQLKQYDPPGLGLTPSDRGTDANLQAARRTGAFYNEAAGLIEGGARARATAADDLTRSVAGVAGGVTDAVKIYEDYAGHKEISAFSAASAKKFSDLNDEWDKRVAEASKRDPNDPTVAAKFREEVLEPELQNLKNGYSNTGISERFAESHVATMRQHFFQTTAAGMSELAKQAVETNFRQTSNMLATAAYKSPGFHNVDYALSQSESSVNAIVDSSNVKGVEAGKLRTSLLQRTNEQIVKAAMAGAIAKADDPEKVAATYAERYPQYINGPEVAQFAKAAKTQARANTLAEKQIGIAERQQADQAAHAASNKLVNDFVSTDPQTGLPVIKPGYYNAALDIARKNPNAPTAAGIAHSAITWGEHQQERKAAPTADDPAVTSDLYSRMFDPNKPTTRIELEKADIERKLTPHTFGAMNRLLTTLEETPLKGEVMKDTLAAVKSSLTYTLPGMPGKDPMGQAAYAKFVQNFIPVYLQQSRTGVLKPNALDIRDPTSLISLQMKQFKRDPKQIMQDRVDEMKSLGLPGDGTAPITPPSAPAGPPVVPDGMSIEDAQKKFGKGATVLYNGKPKVLP